MRSIRRTVSMLVPFSLVDQRFSMSAVTPIADKCGLVGLSAKCQYLAGTGKSRCLRDALRRLNYSTPSNPRVCWHTSSQWLLNLLSLTCKIVG